MQIKVKDIKSRTEKISGQIMSLNTGVKDANKQDNTKSNKGKGDKKKEAAPAETKADPLAPPASVPKPSEAYTTYDDDVALGQSAPSLDTLEYVKGDAVTLGSGKVSVHYCGVFCVHADSRGV